MISTDHYFGAKPHPTDHDILASDLLARVNDLRDEAERAGIPRHVCPNTGTEISGSKGGSGDGGYRLPGATTGAAMSSHKEGRAVDVYDPLDNLDEWLDQFEHGVGDNTKLAEYGLYRETPAQTPTWCHLTTRPPKSGRRTFNP